MVMSPDQIAAAASYFGAKSAARGAAIQQLGAAPMFTGVSAAAKASASKGSAAATNKAIPAGITPANAVGKTAPNSLESGISSALGGIPGVGGFIKGQLPWEQGSIVQQALAPQGSDQAPQNFTQGVLNFLSGGAYASGRFIHDIGQNVSDMNKKISSDPTYVGSPQYYADLAHGAVSPFGGAARGLAEGFGARFDNQAPILPGNDLKSIGATTALNKATADAVGGLTGNKGAGTIAGNIAGGGLEFAGNVALDPTTYIGGTGLVKGLLKGASEFGTTARAGGGVVDALAAGAKGVVKGAAASRADAAALKAEAGAARAADKAGQVPAVSLADQQAADAAARAAASAPAAPIHPDVAAQIPADIRKLFTPELTPKPGAAIPNEAALPKLDTLPTQGPSSEVSKLFTPEIGPNTPKLTTALDPRAQAVQDLLPSLKTTDNTGKILSDATTLIGAKSTPLTDSTANAVRAVFSAPQSTKDITEAVKAIKATPDGATFLSRRVRIAGQPQTIEKVLTDGATNHLVARNSGGQPSAKGLLNAKAINQALDLSRAASIDPRAGANAATQMSRESLTSAIGNAGLGDTPNIADIVQRAMNAKSGAERQAVLQQAFGQGTGFKNFDQAMKAAADGQVESSVMRSMLKALGVNTTAKTSNGLQKALSARGAMNWDEIKNLVPTPQEILDSHGVSSTVSDAAKTVDPQQAMADAAAQYEKNVAQTAGTDPTVLEPHSTNTPQGLTGTMINHGVKAVMDLSEKTHGVFSDLYNNAAWLAVHRALMGVIRHAANGQALEGTARQGFIYDRYAEAIREVETHQRSLGQQPQLQYGAGEQPLYVSFGQIYHALPRDVMAPALFDLNHALGAGMGNAAYTEGLSVLPTTIGNGVRAAINGADTAGIRAALKNKSANYGLNAFERSPEGQLALDNLALAISDPAVIAHLKALHDSQQILATGKAMQDAASVVKPIQDAIVAAVSKTDGGRQDIVAAVNAGNKAVKDMAPAEAESLTRDMASQQMQNGITNGVQDVGVAMARADKRAAKAARGDATQAEVKAGLDKATAAYKAAKTKTGEQIPPSVSPPASAIDRATRWETAKGIVAWSEDMAPHIEATAQDAIKSGQYEDTMLGNIAARTDAEIQSGFARTFSTINHAFNGQAGQGALAGIRTDAVKAASDIPLAYRAKLRAYMWGTTMRPPGFFGKWTKEDGIANQLGVELGLGRAAKVNEMNPWIASTMSKLAAHEQAAGRPLSDAEMAAALQQGRVGIGNANVGGADAMTSDAQVQMALELYALNSGVFHPDGLLMRAGVTPKDIMREMDNMGVRGGPLEKYLPPAGKVADLGNLWHAFDYSTMEHPLDVLNMFMHSVSAATVRPAIAAAAAHMFDHIAADLSPTEAAAQGFVKIDTKAADAGLGAYLPPDSLFPKDLIPKMSEVNRFLTQMEKPIPPVLAKMFRIGDPITNIWKQGVTTINPRHQVSNILGDFGMNILGGINPLYAGKAFIAMHELGKVGNAPLDELHQAIDGIADAKTTVKPQWHSSTTTVTIGGSKGGFTKTPLTPQQLWDWLPSAFQNPHDATDVVSMLAKKSGIESKPNPLSEATRALGDFSSSRDNFPRLAHLMGALESRPFKSLEEAKQYALNEVHKWHPTIAAMSPFEQKYVRRTLMFYSWSRQALGAVISTSLEHPSWVTMPSKFQYSVANEAGFNPESVGKPTGTDPRIPSYEADSVYGPTFAAGDTPGDIGQPATDGTSHLWGLSLSTPQLDAMTSFFGGVSLDNKAGPVVGFLQGQAASLNPLISTPLQAGLDFNASGIGKKPSQDPIGFWSNATGIGGTAVNILGLNPKSMNVVKPTDSAAVAAQKNATQQAAQQRALLNWISGLKFIDYTNATASKIAGTEHSADDTAKLTAAGYSPAQIKTIKAIWKSQQTAAANNAK